MRSKARSSSGWKRDAKVGERVADFGALVEPRAADDAIGHADFEEPLLELAHLERGAHQNRHVGERDALFLRRLDLVADRAGLLGAVPDAGDDRRLSPFGVGEQRLAQPIVVVGDEPGSDGEDMSGRAVIALQPDHLGAGKIVLETQDIVDFGAAPTVDRLIVVADAAHVAMRLGDQAQP